jgi:uncharacterized membrane protein YtjA (UPF0391 family)
MKSKTAITIISFVQIVLISVFLYCSWQADQAMDKTGSGNLELWQQYNSYAGIAFYLAVVLWVVSIILAVSAKCFKENRSQIAIVLPPVIMVLGWFILWFI